MHYLIVSIIPQENLIVTEFQINIKFVRRQRDPTLQDLVIFQMPTERHSIIYVVHTGKKIWNQSAWSNTCFKNVLRVYDTIVKDLQKKKKLFVMEKMYTKYTAHPRGQRNKIYWLRGAAFKYLVCKAKK